MIAVSVSVSAYSTGRTDPETVRTFFPMWLLAVCVLNLVTSAGERAIAFTPSEVDFLFAGPFTRRELLAYKLLKSAAGAVLTASLFSILFGRYLQSWAAGPVGIFLSLLFLQLLSMAVVLIGETLGRHADTRGRKMVAGVMIASAALALLTVMRTGRATTPSDVAVAFASSDAGRFILAPFAVFGRVFTARQLVPDAMPALLLALGVLGSLLTIVMWLDAQYVESAERAGQKRHARTQRMRRGDSISFAMQRGVRMAWIRLPHPPRAGGVGPIAWRQMTTAVRQSRGVLTLLLVIGAALGPVLYIVGAAERRDPVALIIAIMFCMNLVFANAVRFDFRGDLDQLDMLKSLPVRPAWIVVAQLIAPSLVLTVCQIALLVGAGAFLAVDTRFLVVAAAIAVPLNALLFAIENLLFLLFPARMSGVSAGDLQGVGRRMTIFVVKLAMILVACTLAAGAGGAAWLAAGKSSLAFVLTTAGMLALATAALVPPTVGALRRFDPSSDTPP